MKPLIELKDVWKTYYLGENVLDVLKGVNVTIDKGEFVVIIGPSGSGKSTLMNQVGVLDIPTSGTIFLEDKDISTLEESELAQLRGKKIGFVFQQFNLLAKTSAMDNVSLPLVYSGESESNRYKKAKEILNRVGLGDRLENAPNQLSGGQQQRVAIARALIAVKKILFNSIIV